MVLMLSFLQVVAQESLVFEQANSTYNEGRYEEAIQLYESILDEKLHSSDLYFNLANAYYKSNQVAPSIYYYERALQLNPDDVDIQNNLSFAKNMTVDAIEPLPQVGLKRVVKNMIQIYDFEVWAILSIAMMVLFVLFFLMYYFSISTARKRVLFLGSFSCLALALISLSFAFQNYQYEKQDNPAIVFAQETQVHTDPNLRSETVFNLHEGTKVQVLEDYDENWSKIKLDDGKTGWIASEDIKLLKVF